MARTKEELAAISRANGAKSRGPRTAEGKAVSSKNALKHGMTAKKMAVVDLESEGELIRFSAAMRSHYKPQTIEEALWVDRIITCLWRARRVTLEESELIADANSQSWKVRDRYHLPADLQKLDLLMSYEERLMRQVQLAIKELERLRGVRLPKPTLEE